RRASASSTSRSTSATRRRRAPLRAARCSSSPAARSPARPSPSRSRGEMLGRVEPLNLFDLEALAREKLGPMAFDYFASGAHDEVTLRDNVAAWARVRVAPRVLVDVSARSTATRVLGQDVRAPVLVAPTAFHKLAHADGELATARAAGAAGT